MTVLYVCIYIFIYTFKIFKVLLNLQYYFWFIFWFFGQEACGILALQPGIKPPALGGEV